MDKPALTLRPPQGDELRLVRSSWFKSYHKAGAPPVGYDVYLVGQHAVIDHLLDQPKVEVVVVTPENVPTEICAWICREGSCLHYVYTKQAYRRLGIQKQLLLALGPFTQHSHETRAGRALLRYTASRFNPYLLMKGNP